MNRGARVSAVVMVSAVTACSSAVESAELPPGKRVSRAEFNSGPSGLTDIWPLTVDAGTLSCLQLKVGGEIQHAVVFTTEDGTQYALNGTASNTGRYHDLRGIWATDPLGTWKDASYLIDAGLHLCPRFKPGP